ncbi:MAG: hypothetical protein ACYTAF_15800 [Planctomycetota bacterium]|jgi:hypothetical protein
MLRTILFLATVTALLSSPAAAQDQAAWQEAVEQLRLKKHDADPEVRKSVILRLGEATYPAVDKTTVSLIIDALDSELGRSNRGQTEENTSPAVLEACTQALRMIQDEKAIEFMVKAASGGRDPRRGYYIVSALTGGSGGDYHDELVKLTKHKNMAVQIAAVDALVAEGKPESFDVYIRIIVSTSAPWQVKVAAVEGVKSIVKANDRTRIDRLLDAMMKIPDSQIRVKSDIKDFLNRLLGLNVQSYDANAWRTAMAQKNQGGGAAPPPGGGPAPKGGGAPGSGHKTVAEFFGIKTESNRIIFILDRTGSMADPCSAPKKKEEDEREGIATGTAKEHKNKSEMRKKKEAKEIKKKYDDREIRTKIDALKREYINTVYNLPKQVLFTTVWYNTEQKAWSDKLVPATWENKLDAIQFAEALEPEGGTNIWGALELAFKISGEGKKRVGGDRPAVKTGSSHAVPQKSGPDTFYLLTDGKHNAGKFTTGSGPEGSGANKCDTAAFLAEIKKINKLRQIKIHTICLGDPGVGRDPPDPGFMRQIAEDNNGEFRHVSARAK